MSSANGATLSPNHACGRSKREVYDWAEPGERGRLCWLPKEDIHVDHAYQRTNISQARVNEIAANWSWPALGVIGVCARPDGTKWAYDGQHRTLAAHKRDDILELPCVVFSSRRLSDEAQAFVQANTVRGAMRRLDKYKAQIVAGDKTALAVQELVEACGYVLRSGSGEGVVACVEAIDRAVRTDFKVAQETFLMCATVANRNTFNAKLFNAMFYLEQHLRKHSLSITVPNIRDKIQSADSRTLMSAIEESELYHKRYGAKIGAQGLVQFINKGRRTRHIPAIV